MIGAPFFPSARPALSATALCVTLAFASIAHADDAPPAKPPPHYGRPAPPESPWRATALWLPRALLVPPYLVSEHLLRRPLGAFITTAEAKHWPTALYDIFTFNDRKAGVIPTALFDFGLNPSVGVYAFYDDAFAKDNALRAHAATWGRDWIVATLADRYAWNLNRSSIALRLSFVRRADLPYYGMGPRSRQENLTRYAIERFDIGPAFGSSFGTASRIDTALGLRSVGFRDAGCCDDPALSSAVAAGRVSPPPGYSETYSLLYAHTSIVLDSRQPRPASGSGVRFDANADPAFELGHATRPRSWLRYGGAVGASLDLTGTQRIVSFTVRAQLVDPLARGTRIPFTEQVSLGGDERMRGYLPGRLVDRSSAVATLQYTWPVWAVLDAAVHAEVGNVFGEHFAGFDTRLLRVSSGLGIRTTSARDHAFELLVAAATRTFEQGAGIDHVRLVLGAASGF